MSRIQIFLFIILLLITLVLIALKKNTDITVSTNISEVLLFPFRTVSNYVHYLNIFQKKIEELEMEVSRLQIENQNLKHKLSTHIIADTLFQNNFRLLKANIIGRDPTNFNGFLYIDKGKADSISINQPVIIQNKLIGKIKSVSENTALVETIENDGFAISGITSRSSVYGIVKKHEKLFFEYIKLDNDIISGDSIFTSGLSEIFPKGILIGTAAQIKTGDNLFFKEITIAPAVKINQIYYVYVIF